LLILHPGIYEIPERQFLRRLAYLENNIAEGMQIRWSTDSAKEIRVPGGGRQRYWNVPLQMVATVTAMNFAAAQADAISGQASTANFAEVYPLGCMAMAIRT